MKDGDDATQKSRHLRDERDAKLYGKMRELMTSDRGAPGAKAKVRNALKRVDSEFDQRGPDIALDRQDAEVMGLCRDVVSKEAWKRWSANACEDAVKNDSIERLKFLHECECPWRKNKILYVCAEHGSTECMKYLLKHGCKFGNHACTTAAEFGFLECLKYLREHGHHWDSGTCEYAAKRGHLECLKYAREHGCDWDGVTCYCAALNGHWSCFIYASFHGCRRRMWDDFLFVLSPYTRVRFYCYRIVGRFQHAVFSRCASKMLSLFRRLPVLGGRRSRTVRVRKKATQLMSLIDEDTSILPKGDYAKLCHDMRNLHKRLPG